MAAAGAGPPFIPYRELNVQNLCEAILFCLRPETAGIANELAARIQRESGIQAAVQSFYRNLPMDKIRCGLLPDRPASWVYKKLKTKQPLFLSKTAAQILISHLRINAKDLEP